MLVLISPAKTLDFSDNGNKLVPATQPLFNKEVEELIEVIKKLSIQDIMDLMDVSEKIAQLNFERFQTFVEQPLKQALFAYKGDVYQGFELDKYQEKEFKFAEKHLRIISGLYGLLKAFDLIKPYRLEMSTILSNAKGKNLYQFWQEKITAAISQEEDEVIINLASKEYSDAILLKKLNKPIINIVFKELHKGEYKIIGIQAKKARGMMANYIIRNFIDNVEELKKFDYANYSFNKELSSAGEYIFTR